MLTARWTSYDLDFCFEAVTSRERMKSKRTYFVEVSDSTNGKKAYGECALFRGLSHDDGPFYEECLAAACGDVSASLSSPFASIRFGFEMAIGALKDDSVFLKIPSPWAYGEMGIPINGLIWMGDKALMFERIKEKLALGFHVLKLKIGGINLEDEIDLLAYIRSKFSCDSLEIRLDANGSFAPEKALNNIERLSCFQIHSIEQPVKAGMSDAMSEICRKSPIKIALDEELIGLKTAEEKMQILDYINPQYIILKPTLIGGLRQADEWVELATQRNIGWWATSALESNIGLNAIAQWVAAKHPKIPQGLGTGQLYKNNVPMPLSVKGDRLFCEGDFDSRFMDKLLWRQ